MERSGSKCAFCEVLEETRYKVRLEYLLGIYQRQSGDDDKDYFRIILIGKLANRYRKKTGDPQIEKADRYPRESLLKGKLKLRSREVQKEITEYAQGNRLALDALSMYRW